MSGLESFGVKFNVYTTSSARALEEAFRLPIGGLAAGEEVYIANASRYMDGAGVSSLDRTPEDTLGEEFIAD
jgi:hypothetical protein